MRLKSKAFMPSKALVTQALLLCSLFYGVPAAFAGDAALSSAPSRTVSSPAAPLYSKPTTPIIVTVRVNTVPKGDFFVELGEEGTVFFRIEDLDVLKLKYAPEAIVLIHEEQYAPTGSVPGVTSSFDEVKLAVSFIGKTLEAQKTETDVFSLEFKPRNIYYPREVSAFLNYGLSSTYTDPLGFQSFTSTNKLGARAGDVFFTSDSLYTKTEESRKFVRLQSSATYERRDDLQWLVLGDQFASSGDLGGSVNMAGLGLSKVYKLDPYFITQPVFDLKGSVIYPTQADVYLDGVLVKKQQIEPGTFDLRNIYSYSGSHQIEVVLRDPFGNEQRISSPVYFNTLMLRQGLHEYRYNAGFLREQYGVLSNDYGKPVFTAFHRYGLTNAFNIGFHAEGSDDVRHGGVSAQFAVPGIGAFALSHAQSSARESRGSATSFQHSYQQGSLNTNVLVRGFSRGFATISAPDTGPEEQIRHDVSVGTGFLLPPLGSVSLGYAESAVYDGTSRRSLTATYSRTISLTTSLFVTASDTRQPEPVLSLFVGLNFNFDNNMHGSTVFVKTGDANTETAQIQSDVPVGEGFGYRASLSRSDTGEAVANSFNPFVQYNARYGTLTLDTSVQNSRSQTTQNYIASAAGSFVYAGGFFGLSRPVSDSFAIVMVDKVAGAAVMNNGQHVGTTGFGGRMVVPTLSSYGRNQITLDVKDIPMDYSISGVNQAFSPSLWSGACIAFDAIQVRAVTGTLSLAQDGKTMPLEYLEVSMKVGDTAVTFPTGKNGEFYVENTLPEEGGQVGTARLSCSAIAERKKTGAGTIPPGTYPAWIETDAGPCRFSIPFPDTEEVIAELGEIQCVIDSGMHRKQ
jgi:outer membrane usher protein FimD/PapC